MKKKLAFAIALVIVLVLMIFGFNSCSSSSSKSTAKEDKTTINKKETANNEKSNETEDKNESSTISDDKNKSESTTLPNTKDNKTTTVNTTSKSSSSTSNTKPNNGGSSSTKLSTHTHNWVKKVIHHDAVTHTEQILVSEAYDEPIYETKYADVCNVCGADISDDAYGHLFETEHDSYRTALIKVLVGYNHHEAVYETKTIVDKAAYDEVIYTCSCGATK